MVKACSDKLGFKNPKLLALLEERRVKNESL